MSTSSTLRSHQLWRSHAVNRGDIQGVLGSRSVWARLAGTLAAKARGIASYAAITGAVALGTVIGLAYTDGGSGPSVSESQMIAQPSQRPTLDLDQFLMRQGMEAGAVASIRWSSSDRENMVEAIVDSRAIKSACKESTSNRDCAALVHELDPFLSIVALVENLPSSPYYPRVGTDRFKVSLPGGYSVDMRVKHRGASRVMAELLAAGLDIDQARLIIADKDKKAISNIRINLGMALGLVRMLKPEYEEIARTRVNANGHDGAFESLSREQQAALTYAAWNTGTVYQEAITPVRRLASIQEDFARQAKSPGGERTPARVQVLIDKAADLTAHIRQAITPNVRTSDGSGYVKNHRMASYVHAWLSGRSVQVVVDSQSFEQSQAKAWARQSSPSIQLAHSAHSAHSDTPSAVERTRAQTDVVQSARLSGKNSGLLKVRDLSLSTHEPASNEEQEIERPLSTRPGGSGG